MPKTPEDFMEFAKIIITNVRNAQDSIEVSRTLSNKLNELDEIEKCKLILVMALALAEINELMGEHMKAPTSPPN